MADPLGGPSQNRKTGDDEDLDIFGANVLTADLDGPEIKIPNLVIPQDILEMIAEITGDPDAYLNLELPRVDALDSVLAADELAARDEFTGTKTENTRLNRAKLGYGAYEGINAQNKSQEKNQIDPLDAGLNLWMQLEEKIQDLETLLGLLEKREALKNALEKNEIDTKAAVLTKAGLVNDNKRVTQDIAQNTSIIRALKENADSSGLVTREYKTANGAMVVCAVGKDGRGYCIATPEGTQYVSESESEKIDEKLANGFVLAHESPDLTKALATAADKQDSLFAEKAEVAEKLIKADKNLASLSKQRDNFLSESEKTNTHIAALKKAHGYENVPDDQLPAKVREDLDDLYKQRTAVEQQLGLTRESIITVTAYKDKVATLDQELKQLTPTGTTVAPGETKAAPAVNVAEVAKKMEDMRDLMTTTIETVSGQQQKISNIDKEIAERTISALSFYQKASEEYKGATTDLAATKSQLDTLKTQQFALGETKSALERMQTLTQEVNTAIKGFEGTRKEFIYQAFGGEMAFHTMNAKSLFGGAKPDLVKTDAGDVVFKDEKGLFTFQMNAKGKPVIDPTTKEPVRVDITDPLQVAKLEHDAWVGNPPKLFGNERPQGLGSAITDLGKFWMKKDDKDLSAMRVQDAVANINGQLKNIDTQLAATNTQLSEMNSKVEALKEKMLELNQEVAGYECEIYDLEREVLLGIENDWISDEDLEKIYNSSKQYFKEEIDLAIKQRDKRYAADFGLDWGTDGEISDIDTLDPAPDQGQLLADEYKVEIANIIDNMGGEINEADLQALAADYGITDPVHFEILKAELVKENVGIKPAMPAEHVLYAAGSTGSLPKLDNVSELKVDNETAAAVKNSVIVVNDPSHQPRPENNAPVVG